jgi:ribulose-5-phosphate 4-epimerase/fuculose-1-phosphate aldolase
LHTDDVVAAAHSLAAAGLVTAFGHVSVRKGTDEGQRGFLITPPEPLGSLKPHEPLQEVPLTGDGLPDGVPKEAWIHRAIYDARPDVGAICRAQPPVATAVVSGGLPIRVLHGQGAFLGREVPVYGDARLIRERGAGEALARSLGYAGGVVMRGNGAVTVGADVGAAAARMWVLERSAEMNRDAASAGSPEPLSDEEFAYWESVSEEILKRIWAYLQATPNLSEG